MNISLLRKKYPFQRNGNTFATRHKAKILAMAATAVFATSCNRATSDGSYANVAGSENRAELSAHAPLYGDAPPVARADSASGFQPPKPPKNMLIINSYNESAPWVQSYITPFLMEAAGNEDLDCNLVHMNGTLIRTDSLYRRIEEGIFDRFKHNEPDYLVLIGSMAFSLRDRIQSEWGENIPMLCLGANDSIVPGDKYLSGSKTVLTSQHVPLSEMRSRYNFTYIEVPDLYEETVDLMVGMQPGMQKLLFASDDLASNLELNEKIRNYLSRKYPELEYEWLVASENSRKEMQKYLNSTDPSVGILLSSWYYSRPSAFGYPMLVTGDFKLIASSLRPVFTLKENYLESGAIGGYFADRQEILENCMSALKKMIADGNMRNIPFAYPSVKRPKVNYGRLEPEGLSAENCPGNTLFINKPETLWELYAWQIVLGLIASAALFGILMLRMTFQRRRIRYMASRDKMVNNMPVCYMTGKIATDSAGKPAGVDFSAGNCEANELVAKNAPCGDRNALFDSAYILALLDNVCKTKKSIQFTHYFARTDTYYDFLVCQTLSDEEVELFGVDVTEKVKSENSLKETSKTLEMTLNVAHIIPWKWDLKKHTIACEANRIMRHMRFSRLSESTVGTHVIDEKEYFKRIHPEDREYVGQLCRDLLDGTEQYVKGEFRILSENKGAPAVDWIEVNASVAKYDDERRPEQLIGSLLLITARKEQEASLIAAKEAAKESDRLKSAFLANMSHEIRTPLNAIVGFSNLLTTTEDKEQQQKFVNIIENNNQLLLQLIGDILDLAKVEANTLEFIYKPTDLNELVRGIEETMRMKVQQGVVLNYALGAADCCIETEPNRLSQVLINLLTNACKFTNKGSITFGYELHEDEIQFFVRDTGCGISKEGQERIFQRFTKLNDFVQGTGLGLSICRSIVEKMKGAIGVESKGEGKGSTFWFTVPYLPAAVEKEVEIIEEPKEAIEREKVTVLVAEDNESNYMLFESILGSHYRLVHAWDGVEAVELFDEHNPQLIIMDINMPKMDGYEATREIRKRSAAVPIIAVTAYAFASDKERIMENGFNSYVSKPINAKRLDEELKSALRSHFILL